MAGHGWSVAGAPLLRRGRGARRPGAAGRQRPSGSPSPASPAGWDGAYVKKVNGLFIKIQAGAVYLRRRGEWFVFGEGGTAGGTDNSIWVLAEGREEGGPGKGRRPWQGTAPAAGAGHAAAPAPPARLRHRSPAEEGGVRRLQSPRNESSKASALTHGALSPRNM